MTTPFYAGMDLTAAELNDALPQIAYVPTDVSKTSSTSFSDATGLSLPVEANAEYALDAYLAYNAGEIGDLTLQILVPTSATGHWGIFGLVPASTGSVGNVTGARAAVGSGGSLSVAGSSSFAGAMLCLPRGYISTGGTAGDIEFQFAQATSALTATVVKAGSWMRLTRLA